MVRRGFAAVAVAAMRAAPEKWFSSLVFLLSVYFLEDNGHGVEVDGHLDVAAGPTFYLPTALAGFLGSGVVEYRAGVFAVGQGDGHCRVFILEPIEYQSQLPISS